MALAICSSAPLSEAAQFFRTCRLRKTRMGQLLLLDVGDDATILLVILLEGGQVLAGLSEITLFRFARAFPRVARSCAWAGYAARGWSYALSGLMCSLENFYNRAAQKAAGSNTSSR
jgi:hypothetical protein